MGWFKYKKKLAEKIKIAVIKYLQVQILEAIFYKTSFGSKEIVEEAAIFWSPFPTVPFYSKDILILPPINFSSPSKHLSSLINILNDLEFSATKKTSATFQKNSSAAI